MKKDYDEKEIPYEYYDKKLGFKTKYLISDLDYHIDSIKVIKHNALYKRLKSNTCHEKQLRRGSFGIDALVEFSSLCLDWKERIILKFGKPQEEIKKSWFASQYVLDREAFDFYLAYTYGDKKKLDHETITMYTHQAAVLNTVLLMKNNRKQYLRSLGCTSVDIWESLSRDVNAFHEVDHKLPTTKSSLRYKVTKYEKEGYSSLISGKFGMQNALKVKEREQEALLDELLAKHTNLDNTLIATVYNAIAEQKNWPTITNQTVANRKEKSNLVIYAGRNGVSALSNNILMQNKREKPSTPMLYWTLDGWDAELLYQSTIIDKKGYSTTTYHNRLTMVVVLDPFNKYPVGYAIGTHETPELIKEALRNALNHTTELFGERFKPYQIQSDNYQKKVLTPVYEACAKFYTPAKVKNAKSKVIEPYFGHINKTYCRLMDNWSGFGIASGSKNQPNSEMLNTLRHSFPDEMGCRKQLESIIATERSKKQKEYVENWQNVQDEYRLPMPTENYLLALGKTSGSTNRLEGSGLHTKIAGTKHTYDCFDLNFRHQSHQNWTILYDDNNLKEVLAVSKDQKYRFVLHEKYTQSMAIADHKEHDGEERRKVNEHNKTAIQYITNTRAENAEVLDKFFNSNPMLNDTLAKHLLVDSRGQHKDRRNSQRIGNISKKLLEKQEVLIEQKVEKTWQDEQNDYIKSKININKYLH